MLLRVRVTLPDRPGALGQVARTLGVAGADIVQVVVLERLAGRAVDEFTVSWPGGMPPDRLAPDLAAIPGVGVDGIWRATSAMPGYGHDAQVLSQVAANPAEGLATLVDAVPGLLATDWAVAVVVPADWAANVGGVTPQEAAVAYASWQTPENASLPDVTPLRARAVEGSSTTRYAVAPFGRAGLVLVVAREDGGELPPTAFHTTEVDRLAQLVHAAAVILGDRLDLVSAPQLAPARPLADAPYIG